MFFREEYIGRLKKGDIDKNGYTGDSYKVLSTRSKGIRWSIHFKTEIISSLEKTSFITSCKGISDEGLGIVGATSKKFSGYIIVVNTKV